MVGREGGRGEREGGREGGRGEREGGREREREEGGRERKVNMRSGLVDRNTATVH